MSHLYSLLNLSTKLERKPESRVPVFSNLLLHTVYNSQSPILELKHKSRNQPLLRPLKKYSYDQCYPREKRILSNTLLTPFQKYSMNQQQQKDIRLRKILMNNSPQPNLSCVLLKNIDANGFCLEHELNNKQKLSASVNCLMGNKIQYKKRQMSLSQSQTCKHFHFCKSQSLGAFLNQSIKYPNKPKKIVALQKLKINHKQKRKHKPMICLTKPSLSKTTLHLAPTTTISFLTINR